MGLTRLRWIVWRPGAPWFQGSEELINVPCRRAIAALDASKIPLELYVSKQGPTEAWLTVLVDSTQAVRVATIVEPALDPYPRRAEPSDDATAEPLLGAACAAFRHDLDTWSRVALDLHAQPDRPTVQRELISISRGNRSVRAQLEPWLAQRSPTYQRCADRDGLWQRATTACIPGTDAIHWLYNIVLGLDDGTGTAPEAEFRTQLGI